MAPQAVASATPLAPSRMRIPARDSMDGLWLVTCYPFDAVVPGDPLRYVVQTRRLKLNATAHDASVAAGTKPKQAGQNL